MTERATRLAAVWREARRQKARLAGQRQQVLNRHSHISLQAGIVHLCKYFPPDVRPCMQATHKR